MRPEQRCTIASVAGHAMHERANPFYEYFLGGHIDMSGCRYEQYDERTGAGDPERVVCRPSNCA